jgi:hypothetical protein
MFFGRASVSPDSRTIANRTGTTRWAICYTFKGTACRMLNQWQGKAMAMRLVTIRFISAWGCSKVAQSYCPCQGPILYGTWHAYLEGGRWCFHYLC